MHELFRMLKEIPYVESNNEHDIITPEVVVYTDNKRLYNVLDRTVLRPVDMSQEAGAMICEITDIRKKLRYKVTVKHVIKDNTENNDFMIIIQQTSYARIQIKSPIVDSVLIQYQ